MRTANLAVGFAIASSSHAFALGADEVSRPSPPSEVATSEKSQPARVADDGESLAGQDEILLKSVVGFAISNTTERALAIQAAGKGGIQIADLPESQTTIVSRVLQPILTGEITLRKLNSLSAEIETALRKDGSPFILATYPGQEITSGIVAMVLVPARVGNVSIKGNPKFGSEFVADGFSLRSGEQVSSDKIIQDLEWLNENPLRRASIGYSEGMAPDLLDLDLKIVASKSWKVYGGVDNQLSNDLGDERLFLGFQHGDLFSLDHRLTAQYTSAFDPENLQGFSGIYEIPLSIRHLLEISLGYTESESDAAGPLDQSGQFSRAKIGYRIPLPRWKQISHELKLGFEFRDNEYLFASGDSANVKFFQIETAWKGRRFDSLGATRIETGIYLSPGHGIFGSEDADFIALGGDGAESLIARLELERTFQFGKWGTLLARVQGQWSDSHLLSSDQISAAGSNRVRGFDETVGYASRGIVSTIELQSKRFETGAVGNFQAIGFMDGATLDREQLTDPGQLASVGAGIRWRLEDRFSAKAEVGFPIDYPDGIDNAPILHFSFVTNW